MSEILNLAEKFKQKQNEQAQTIEQQLDSVLSQLNSFIIAKLKESESIIKNGMADLSVSNEELQKQLTQHLADIQQLIDGTFSQFQTHIQQSLLAEIGEIEQMIESYTARIAREIESRESQISQVIPSDLSKWTIVAVIVLLTTFIAGAIIGAVITSKVTEPPTYKYYHSKSGQTYMIPLEN